MVARRLLVAAAFFCCGVQALALPVHVTFEWPAGKPSTVTRVHIRAIRMAGHTDGAAPVDGEAAPDRAALDLGDGVWQVRAYAPGYWSQEAELTVTHQSSVELRISLWPAATLHGAVLTAEGETLPRLLEVRLTAVPETNDKASSPAVPTQLKLGPSHAELQCPIEGTTWSCLGPAGFFDVQLKSAEYVPRYAWSVRLNAAASTDIGRTVLRRAASVVGRAVRRDNSDPPGPCRATLQPDLERHGPRDLDRDAVPPDEKSFSVPLDKRGHFQIVGVLPGRHLLYVACQGATALREVRVQSDSETRIDPPLLLQELTLDVAVTPKVDPQGHPWRLFIDATAPHAHRIANGDVTSSEGRWVRRGLMAGKYRVVVSGSDGTAWLQRYFDLGPQTAPLLLRVGSVSVAGRVALSSRPVRARLVFFNDAGGDVTTLTSDENGRFQGLLPVKPGAPESTWTVEAHVTEPPVTQRLWGVKVQPGAGGTSAWLDLDVPTVAVHGSVVSPDGRPQAGVQVTFENSKSSRTTTSTDDAGRFEMADLPPGNYTALADSPDGSSDRTPFEVVEGGGSELKLVLNPFKRVVFTVVSGDGPVPDATVQVWIAPGVPRAFTRTDQDGRFDVALPPRTTEVALTIGAPGYALKMTRVRISLNGDEASDAHTITLDTTSGSLVLKLQPSGATREPATLYLVHDGAIQDARTMIGWGTNQTGVNPNIPAVIAPIEPGKYSLCREDPAQVAALWSGSLPQDRCSAGSLDENDTLTLSAR